MRRRTEHRATYPCCPEEPAVSYEDIRFEVDAGVAVVTLHRPDALNAFSGRMGEELGDAYRRCDTDDAVRVVIVTGAGPF